MIWFHTSRNDYHSKFSEHPSSLIDTIREIEKKYFSFVMCTLLTFIYNKSSVQGIYHVVHYFPSTYFIIWKFVPFDTFL